MITDVEISVADSMVLFGMDGKSTLNRPYSLVTNRLTMRVARERRDWNYILRVKLGSKNPN